MAGGMGMSNQISNWAGGGATTTLGAAQLAYGLYLDKKNKRPTYEIPSEIQQNLTEAQQLALQGLPEEQKQEYISNLQRSQAYSLSELGTRKAGIAGLAALNQNTNDSYAKLLSMDSQARAQNQQRVFGARSDLANYKDQAFQLNKENPYYENRAKAQGLMGSGMQNIGTGFQGGSNSNPYSGSENQGNSRSMMDHPSGYDNTSAGYGEYKSDIDYGGYNGSYGDWMGQQYQKNPNTMYDWGTPSNPVGK